MGSVQTHGCAIRDLRLQQGLTQLQLAELASVSERTIRTAEKGQRISCSHAAYIAGALGVTAADIVPSTIVPTTTPRVVGSRNEASALQRIWDVMCGRLSLLSIESSLHREIQVRSCGEFPDVPHAEPLLRSYEGIVECVQYLEMLWEYLESIGPIQVRMTELCRDRSATALQGTVVGNSSSGSPKTLRFISFAILEDARVQTLINHFDSQADRNAEMWRSASGFLINRSECPIVPNR
jgi:transcriptional regulator with XRE-family HTH domain